MQGEHSVILGHFEDDAGPASEGPGHGNDRNEVEEREAELRPGHHVDEADERDDGEPEDGPADDPAVYRFAPAGRTRCFSSIARICSG